MQQPQYSNYGYAVPVPHAGPAPSYGDHNYYAEPDNHPYGPSYGYPSGDSHGNAPSLQSLSQQHSDVPQSQHASERTPSNYPSEGPYAAPGYYAGTSLESAPSGPPLESQVPRYDIPASYSGGPAPPPHANPNQQGSGGSVHTDVQGSYGAPPQSAYGYSQPHGSAPPAGYGSTDGSQSMAASFPPDTYVDGSPPYGTGQPVYGGQQGSLHAAQGNYAPSYGASYGAHADELAHPGFYQPPSNYQSHAPAPVPSDSPYSSSGATYGQSGSSTQPPSYINTAPQSSNPSHDSIQAGLSSLNLRNPSKPPNYLDRADSGGNNLISFKSNYGGTIRYEAPRTSSYSGPRTGSSSYDKSKSSSELIDIVQGPGSTGGGGYRSGRAQPADTVEVDGGVQRYKVRLMPEDGNPGSSQQVQCQIALDGVRLFNADGKTMLRIYPLESITRWAVQQPTVFTFWAKTSVDVEQRAVKLSSNEGTTTAILDMLTAACVQLGEMIEKDSGGSQAPTSASVNAASSDTAKPKGMSIVEWVTKKPVVEEKQHWIPDESATKCSSCGVSFTAFNRRHHCRNCGEVFCDSCTKGRIALTSDDGAPQVRVCDRCFAEVTHRLQNVQPAKSAAAPPLRSHEDLAKKLQAELDRKKPTQSSSSGGGGGGQTTVLTCKSCGSVSLGSSGDTRCSACGADANKAPSSSSSKQSGGGSRQSSYSTDGPPHLWNQQEAKAPERTRQVACPTCTVHLTVKVPSQGTETVECGVCQHPFLVAA